MNELDKEFIDEICNMRMEIAFKRMLQTRSQVEAERVMARDDAIASLYEKAVNECTEAGRELLRKYSDEVAYRESDEADFYYKSGFRDGVQLVFMLQKMI